VAQAKRQSLIDLVVAIVSVPLLVVFGLMLESNMRGDWTSDPETRWHVLCLGLALLFVSLMVCGYITHRLGICIWAAYQEPYIPHYASDVSHSFLKMVRMFLVTVCKNNLLDMFFGCCTSESFQNLYSGFKTGPIEAVTK
jgi:hypothetical protein